jgi:hypothetical protein
MYARLAAIVLVVLASVATTEAQVHVDIGIHLPAPPQLVVVPEVRAVQWVPTAPANLFFYERQYWAFVNGAWHVSRGHNGPWIVVAPTVVPRPVLLVPVSYYRVPPGHWKQWHRHGPPHWHREWGQDWAAKRQWKARHDDDDHHHRKHGRHDGHGRHGRDRDHDGHGRGKGR